MNNSAVTIRVQDLTKTFRIFKRRVGLKGGIQDLFHRRYSSLKAVNNISFQVQAGEMIGLIGPNGAGKSTTLKMLTGILVPTSGEIEVAGFVPHKNRIDYVRHIGAVFGQRTQLWWDLAVIESFYLLGKIYHVPDKVLADRIAQLDDILEVGDLLHTPVRKLSLGQRMRCDLAASLLHAPDILFLDEPTIGLDIVAKDSVRSFLMRINHTFQTTAIITTHDLRDIEALCNRILIIDHGTLLYDGLLEEVKTAHAGETHLIVDLIQASAAAELAALGGPGVEWEQMSDTRFRATFDRRQVQPADLARTLFNRLEVADLAIPEPSIESVIRRIYELGTVT